MAELPRFESQIRGVQTDVSPALGGIQAAQRGESVYQQGLSDKLNLFFGTATGIAQTKMAQSAQQQAFQDFQEGKSDQKSLIDTGGFSAYRNAYNQRVNELTMVKSKNDIKREFDRIELQNPDSIVEYESMINSFTNSYFKNAPDIAKPELWSYTESLLTDGKRRVTDKYLKKLEENETAETNKFLENTLIDATNAAYTNNNDVAAAQRIEFVKKVDQQISNGLITAEEGRRRKDNFDSAVRQNVFVGAMDRIIANGEFESAKQYLSDFSVGTYKDFGTDERDQIAAKMSQRLNAAMSKRDAMDKAKLKFGKKQIEDAIFVLDNDKDPGDVMGLMSLASQIDAVAETDLAEKLASSYKKNQARGQFKFYTPREMDAIITKYEGKKKFTREEVELLDDVKKLKSRTEKMINDDPLQLGRDLGLTQQTNPFDIEARQQEVDIVNAHYGISTVPALTPEEMGVFKENFETADYTKKTEMVTQVSLFDKSTAQATYAQMAKNGMGAFAMAGSHMLEGRKEVARDIMYGTEVAKANPSIISKEVAPVTTMKIASGLSQMAGHDMKAVYQSIAYHYAARMANQDVSTGWFGGVGEGEVALDEEVLDESIKAVIGEPLSRNDKTFFAPAGVDGGDFDDWLDDITVDDIRKSGGFMGINEEDWDSVYRNAQLFNVKNGVYRLRLAGKFIAKEDGTPFEIRYEGR